MNAQTPKKNIFTEEATSIIAPSWRTWLIGRPLQTADAPHQTIGKLIGLAVFASDALSSTAYATQEILMILALAGTAAFGYAFPISIAITVLMAFVAISYEQTIHAYPGGGGAYIVARDNLGELPAQTAGAALQTDYILTVAVSISSGVAQIVSAYPVMFPYRVHLAVILVMFVMLANLRGVKESGTLFAIPTYFFVVVMFLTVGVGLFRYFTGGLGMVVDPPEMHLVGALTTVTPFLILHAFSSGTAALTGIEAISNGITAFKELDGADPGVIVPGDHLSSRASGGCTFRGGNCDLSNCPDNFWRSRHYLPGSDCRHGDYLDPGCKYCFRRLSSFERPGCGGWISTPPAYLSRQQVGVLLWDCSPGSYRQPINHPFSG
jgi:hypothetical protein